MSSKLNELKKEIQRVRPEIMELKKGCIVFVQNYIISIEILLDKSDWTKIESSNPLDYIGFTGSDDLVNFDKKHITKILGRPITLEDVLFCCVEAYSKFGIITKKFYEEMFGGVVGLWDFTKDFDNQSEEFYDEIMLLLQ